MGERERIEAFLKGTRFAVAGASRDRAKFGNRVLRCLAASGREVWAVNPRETAPEVEGRPCVADVASLPGPIDGLSIVTPPAVTEALIEEAARAGIRRVWMQPGAESAAAIRRAEELGLEPIAGGPCVLVELGC
jgi:uncharacterized protein